MKTQKTCILALLGWGSYKTRELAEMLDAPEASIRRNIQELRRMGHHISSVNGFFTLETPVQEAAQEVAF